jgi:Cu(I)/Ag(I) efflux system membrane fusion protein
MGMDLIPVYADDAGAAGPGVRIDPSLAFSFGVRLAAVERAPLDLSFETLGTVALAEPGVHHVHPRVPGWIERLTVDAEGDPVAAGQVLLELYAPDLVRAQEEFLIAREAGEAGLIDASRARLRALGMGPDQIAALAGRGRAEERIAVRAERDGFVLALNVREGMYVEPETEVMAVGSLDPVWVTAEVFERQVPAVAAGRPAELTVDYLPGRRWRGEVDYVYPQLDAATRTLPVRMVFPNPDGVLRPGMFGRLRLLEVETEPVLQIPAEALIPGVGAARNRVVVALGDDRYRARAVATGRRTADRIEIRAGLREGERVVASGQFLIDSESDVDAELLRMGALEALPSCVDGTAASGRFLGVLPPEDGRRRVRIAHDPVPALTWPAMTMPFLLAEGVDVSSLSEGDTIRFCIVRPAPGRFEVTELRRAEADVAPEPAGAADRERDHAGPAPRRTDHSGPAHRGMDHSGMDHSGMDHSGPAHRGMDHSGMDHAAPSTRDRADSGVPRPGGPGRGEGP